MQSAQSDNTAAISSEALPHFLHVPIIYQPRQLKTLNLEIDAEGGPSTFFDNYSQIAQKQCSLTYYKALLNYSRILALQELKHTSGQFWHRTASFFPRLFADIMKWAAPVTGQ
jgi:hypothetical protein